MSSRTDAVGELCALRLQQALQRRIAMMSRRAPPGLAQALWHAVEPPGSRRRSLLCMAVAQSLEEDCPAATDAAAVALELVHCASLVHDDLPCFDDAPTRRGVPSLHRAFGEPLAVLVGDGLLLGAFEALATADCDPQRRTDLISILSQAAGCPSGMVAGQAWESEPEPDLQRYHRAKTASAFEAATMMGAVSAGHDPAPWRKPGTHIGLAYQIADDLRDVAGNPERMGKPVGRDASLSRPSAVREGGIRQAVLQFVRHREAALASLPEQGHRALRARIAAIFDDLGAVPGFSARESSQ
jgi:geranylgeranyl diphosphate synthase type II